MEISKNIEISKNMENINNSGFKYGLDYLIINIIVIHVFIYLILFSVYIFISLCVDLIHDIKYIYEKKICIQHNYCKKNKKI